MAERSLSDNRKQRRTSRSSKIEEQMSKDAGPNASKSRASSHQRQQKETNLSRSLKATQNLPSAPSSKKTDRGKSKVPVGWSLKRLKTFRSQNLALREDYREWLREALVDVYEIAIALRDDRKEWKAFCNDPDWERFRGKPSATDDQHDALMFAVRFFAGFSGRKANLRKNRFMKRLESFRDLTASSTEVREHLRTHRLAYREPALPSTTSGIRAQWHGEHKRKFAKLTDGVDVMIEARVRVEGESRVLKIISFKAVD